MGSLRWRIGYVAAVQLSASRVLLAGVDGPIVSISVPIGGVLRRVPLSLWLFVVGGLVGVGCWGNCPQIWWLAGLLTLPLAWGIAESRLAGASLMFGYFLGGARSFPASANAFFPADAPASHGVLLYLAVCVVLTLPFVVFWAKDVRYRVLGFLVAVGVSCVPPIGVVGWGSPLVLAGLAFPLLGWMGLVFAMGSMAAVVVRSRRWLAVLFALAVAANVTAQFSVIEVPRGWKGVDTQFRGVRGSGGRDDFGQMLASMARVEWLQEYARSLQPGSVVVLPETIVGAFDGLARMRLRSTERDLAANGSRILVGAEIYESDGRFKNGILVLGAGEREERFAVQGIPVPVSMWKPWSNAGASADIFGRGHVITVGGVKVAAVLCYEHLLAFSMLRALALDPGVLVAVSNVWWAQGEGIPNIQNQTVGAFARLFGVPVVYAKNV